VSERTDPSGGAPDREPATAGDAAAGSTGAADSDDAATADAGERAPRSARILVAVLFVLLLVPGVIGFDAWPLTGWRLFSVSRDAEQTRWVVRATDAAGETRTVSLEELPLRYRHAEWPMSELPGASDERRQDVCVALLDAVVDVEPATVELAVARDRARLVEEDGHWRTEHDYEAVATCSTGADALGGAS
jgi:hypothetical protein